MCVPMGLVIHCTCWWGMGGGRQEKRRSGQDSSWVRMADVATSEQCGYDKVPKNGFELFSRNKIPVAACSAGLGAGNYLKQQDIAKWCC